MAAALSMDLSIIIINYKSADYLLACLESIYKETHKYSFEIIIVDNDSGDNSEAKVLGAFPNVKWIQSGYNAGFARANNIGFRKAGGEYILVLNADTAILENAIDKTIDLFKTKHDAAGCGVQLFNPDGSHQISGAYFIKGGLNFLLPLPYFGALIRYLGYKLNTKIPSVKAIAKEQEVDWIVGAFIMIKKEILLTAGLFDEDFFIYAEEIEWCSRLRKEGKLYLFSEPKVTHVLGGSSNEYYNTTEKENGVNVWNNKARQIIISHMLRIRKQLGLYWFLFNLFVYILEIPFFFICLLISKIFTLNKARYTWEDLVGYTKNVFSLLYYSPKIILNKPYFYKVL